MKTDLMLEPGDAALDSGELALLVSRKIAAVPYNDSSMATVAEFVYNALNEKDVFTLVLSWWLRDQGYDEEVAVQRAEKAFLIASRKPACPYPPSPSDQKSGGASVEEQADNVGGRVAEDSVIAGVSVEPTMAASPSIFDKFALNNKLGEIDALAVDHKPLFSSIALMGQLSIYYGPPNSGKTLIILALIIAALQAGLIDKGSLYYINADDTAAGLAEKIRIANEFGLLMLADSYSGFVAAELEDMLRKLADENVAAGKIIVLDTVTKFVNVLDATKTRRFMTAVRRFVARGGTVIGLAHTNKNPDARGKQVYRGTSDIINDADCVYVLSVLRDENRERVVVFENQKRRGDVKQVAGYCYTTADGISYHERLASVEEVDPTALDEVRAEEVRLDDTKLIGVVVACIQAGVTTKMLLADAAAKRAQVSKRAAIKVIDRYTGDDPTTCHWRYRVHERGAKVFELLPPAGTPEGERR